MENLHRNHPISVGLIRAIRSGITAYSQIYFSKNVLSGLLFLAATMVVPNHGISGIVGLLSANLFARLLGRPSEQIGEGYYGFNGLLVALALGLYFRFSLQFVVLLLLSTFLTVVVAATMREISGRYLGLPVLSLPFVVVTWVALLATRRFAGVEVTIDTVLVTNFGAGVCPQIVELYFRSLAAAFFQMSVVSGFLVFVGLFIFSRWAVILSILGFASGYGVYIGLGGGAVDLYQEFVGFNFILTAIAVGGIWIVLGPASIVYSALGGGLSAVVSAAALSILGQLGLPILASPFIFTTQLLLFAIIIRTKPGRLKMVLSDWDSPEQNLSRAIHRERRYPDPSLPVAFLPVLGDWTITQGPGGEITHRGLWAHAWDFEVLDDNNRSYRNEGTRAEDYYAYQASVVSPNEGKVVRVVNHLEDQPIGEVDTVNNWGNLVIIRLSGDVYCALCHLKKGSIKVKEGETVTRGQIIGQVGNSGRSPFPHLHFQFQSSMEIGAPTRFGEFIHYTAFEDENLRYMTHGVPKTGTRISSMSIDDVVRRSVVFTPSKSWHWDVTIQGKKRTEIWRSEIDSFGNRTIREVKKRSRVSFFADDHYTTMLDYRGSGSRLLGLLYLGAARAPFVGDEMISWSDIPCISSFMSLLTRQLHDLVLPFVFVQGVKTESSICKRGQKVILTTTLTNGSFLVSSKVLPDTIIIEFVAGVGPTSIRSYKNGKEMVAAELCV